jgi:hypothetical protein
LVFYINGRDADLGGSENAELKRIFRREMGGAVRGWRKLCNNMLFNFKGRRKKHVKLRFTYFSGERFLSFETILRQQANLF